MRLGRRALASGFVITLVTSVAACSGSDSGGAGTSTSTASGTGGGGTGGGANAIACEHVSLQTRSNEAVLAKLRHVGAVYVGPYAPVAAGDYVAGPSHCLPTNTTARFASGISVYEFLKRSSVVNYERDGLARDADAITALAEAEQLDAHAASVRVRLK